MAEHPMQPSPKLVWKIARKAGYLVAPDLVCDAIGVAYAAGADAQLEAGVEWLIKNQNPRWAEALRAAMRPKPPSLKQQALEALDAIAHFNGDQSDEDIIRRALEALPDDI